MDEPQSFLPQTETNAPFQKSCLTSNVKYVQYFGYTLPHISSIYTVLKYVTVKDKRAYVDTKGHANRQDILHT